MTGEKKLKRMHRNSYFSMWGFSDLIWCFIIKDHRIWHYKNKTPRVRRLVSVERLERSTNGLKGRLRIKASPIQCPAALAQSSR
jgi:hypothetical protein